jgi:hypothetical protein
MYVCTQELIKAFSWKRAHTYRQEDWSIVTSHGPEQVNGHDRAWRKIQERPTWWLIYSFFSLESESSLDLIWQLTKSNLRFDASPVLLAMRCPFFFLIYFLCISRRVILWRYMQFLISLRLLIYIWNGDGIRLWFSSKQPLRRNKQFYIDPFLPNSRLLARFRVNPG